MVGFAKVLGIEKEWGINNDSCVWFANPVEFGYCFMKIVKMLENMGAKNLVEGIIFKGVGERGNIMYQISAVINYVKIGISFPDVISATKI